MSRGVCLRGVVGIEGGLWAQNFGVVRRGSFVRFVRLGGEGFDLMLARGELRGLCGELLECGVRECVAFVLEVGIMVLL